MVAPTHTDALCELLLQMADDDLVIGHRDSEWLGIAPEIEGDIAFSSVSQDEVGHATFLYGLVEELTGQVGPAGVLKAIRQVAQCDCAGTSQR